MVYFTVDGRYKELLQYHGINVEDVLRKARLSEDIFNQKTIKMSEQDYYDFMDGIESMCKDNTMPIKLATTAQIETFSPPIFASYSSKNGKVCIERLARYKKLIGPMTFHISCDDDYTIVEIVAGQDEIEVSKFLIQIEMAFLINIIRIGTKENIVPVSVMLKEEIKDTSFETYIGKTITIGTKNCITFKNDDLEEPFLSHSEAMWSYFEPELNKRLDELDIDDSISARVRSVLIELIPGGLFVIDDVAKKLGLSKRTLQRKLFEEDTTFQKQLNNTRELLALHYVKNTDMSTDDIAYLLGYSELNSFLRAFSIWTKQSVSAYRKKNS